ncbi:MAG: DUF2288 domain-containing protein [Geobacteraceae bacterium]|nr:DUF2288 domain-containing protein [Geobacteraceae bacterium]
MTDIKLKEELALNVDEAEWSWLKPHLDRDALITVSSVLDLAEAGERIAANDSHTVSAWINASRVGKPTDDEITKWNADPQKKFLILIVSPYVLIQEIGTIN